MTGTTTAYLSDGRRVDVPRTAAAEWAIAAADMETTLGLGDWYTREGEQHVDDIIGTPQDDTEDWSRCEHYLDGGARVRVTNASQASAYDPTRPHAAATVCTARACILDALAWVERTTGEYGVWIGDDFTVRIDPPAPVPLAA